MELKGKKINFLGDSITEGVGTSDIKYVFWNVVKEMTGAEVRNYGISGTRIARNLNEEPENEFCKRIGEMDKDADIIVIFGGTNDYGHGDAPLGCMSDRCDDTFYGALHLMCIKAIENYPEAQIVIMTPIHRLDENRVLNERGIRHQTSLKGYVDAEREVAEYYSIPVLDLYATAGIKPEIKAQLDLYIPDGLHPSDAGNAKIAQKLISFLKIL